MLVRPTFPSPIISMELLDVVNFPFLSRKKRTFRKTMKALRVWYMEGRTWLECKRSLQSYNSYLYLNLALLGNILRNGILSLTFSVAQDSVPLRVLLLRKHVLSSTGEKGFDLDSVVRLTVTENMQVLSKTQTSLRHCTRHSPVVAIRFIRNLQPGLCAYPTRQVAIECSSVNWLLHSSSINREGERCAQGVGGEA
jgi:hypothetical protein